MEEEGLNFIGGGMKVFEETDWMNRVETIGKRCKNSAIMMTISF